MKDLDLTALANKIAEAQIVAVGCWRRHAGFPES
jgi:hypothetical protein